MEKEEMEKAEREITRICQMTLLHRPGWTETALKKFGLKPEFVNPGFGFMRGRKMYSMADITSIEATPEFQEWLVLTEKRRKIAKDRDKANPESVEKRRRSFLSNAEEKRKASIEFAENAEITLNIPNEPVKTAIEEYKRERVEQGWKPVPQTGVDWGTVALFRIIFAWSNYSEIAAKIGRKNGSAQAKAIVMRRLLLKIDEALPEYGIFQNPRFAYAVSDICGRYGLRLAAQ